ncbi:MAG: nicotinate-nucleotide adenylyltransferase [bacterium]
MKAGIIGGTFDPIHVGHLICADFVRENQNLDRIIFLPASTPPHKLDKKISRNKQRLIMLRKAVEDNPYFDVNDYEINKGGVSFTIESVRHFKQNTEHSNTEFFLIIGADNLVGFKSWKNPDQLLDEMKVLVLRRPGVDITNIKKPFIQQMKFINSPLIDISSSDIRQRIKVHKSIKYLVPKEVEKYIYKKGLYC